MDCPECGTEAVTFAVPADLREHIPAGEPVVALCPRCLSFRPAPGAEPGRSPDSEPAFAAVSDAFPTGKAAVPMALAVGLLDSFALYRADVEALVERVERAGVDPLLVLDRLAADPTVETGIDIPRRRHQLAQLLE